MSLALTASRLGFRALSLFAPPLAARVVEQLWFQPRHLRIRDEQRAFLRTGARAERPVNGRPVITWTWGSPGARRVILSHGWGGYAAQMQHFVAPLVAAGFEVVAFDAPGHGESGASRVGARSSTLLDFADVVVELTRETSGVAGVVAHSGGGAAAAWALRDLPADAITRLVLIAPMASAKKYQVVFQRALGFSDAVLERFRANTERSFGIRWSDWEVPEMIRTAPPPPTLVFHDREDRETAWSEGAAIADAWPGAELHTTTGLGHNRILRDASVVERAVSFISR